jgi:hypothetical protein
MKHGSIKAVCLVVLACMTVLSAYGDDNTVDLTSIVLERFNGETGHEWNDGRHARSYEFSWGMSASRFATKTTDQDGNDVNFPLSTYVEAWPIALFGYNREGKDIKSFGIHGRFDRRGYNWIDMYPVNEDAPFEIPIPGRARYLDMWVWGSNLNYYIEAFVRDYQGIVHRIYFGSLNYTGWRNMRALVPVGIPQSKRIQPNLASLKFVKFRIWTMPEENVGDFYIYFKQLKVLTDTFESLFDGDDLADPDRIPELWANGSSDTTK